MQLQNELQLKIVPNMYPQSVSPLTPRPISVLTFLLELLRGAPGQGALGASHGGARVKLLATGIRAAPLRG